MALTIYPTEDYTSYISLADASTYISENSLHNDTWVALADSVKEVYLRVATSRIDNIIDSTLLNGTDLCLTQCCAMMAVRDVAYSISSEVNPNMGVISKEKIGDLEVNYFHSSKSSRKGGKVKSPYPPLYKNCLVSYGASFSLIPTTTLGKS